jgi:hypothetical protein
MQLQSGSRGYQSEAVIGHTVEILLPPAARHDILQRHELARRGEVRLEFRDDGSES